MKRWGLLLATAAIVFLPKIAFAQATFPPTTPPPATPAPGVTPTPTPQAGALPNNGSPAQALGIAGTTAVEVGAGLMMWSAANKNRRRRKKDATRPPSAAEQLLPIPRIAVERPRVYAVTPAIAQLYRGPRAPKAASAPPSRERARPQTRSVRDWRRS